MKMVPGMGQQLKDVEADVDERRIDRIEGIINSMTPAERVDPDVIDGSRRARIAAGSGTQATEVSQLVRQFREMRKMMKGMAGTGTKAKVRKDRGKKSKKGKKGPGRAGGSRVQPKETQQVPKLDLEGLDLTLPGR